MSADIEPQTLLDMARIMVELETFAYQKGYEAQELKMELHQAQGRIEALRVAVGDLEEQLKAASDKEDGYAENSVL